MNDDDEARDTNSANHGQTLQESVDRLRAVAKAMDDLPSHDMTVPEAQLIARHQARIRSLAAELVCRQIELLTREAAVSAAEINAAVRFAQQAIADTRDAKVTLGKVASLIEFVGVILTGDRAAIVRSAVRMRSVLAP